MLPPEIVIFAVREDVEVLALTLTVMLLLLDPEVGEMLHHEFDDEAVHDILLVTLIVYEAADAVALIELGDTVRFVTPA